MPDSLKMAFAGSPAFATDILAELLSTEGLCEIQAVFTQPDKPAGRGKRLQPSCVKRFACEKKLPLYQPEKLVDLSPTDLVGSVRPDLLLTAAYGLLLPKAWLSWPKLGTINVHTSLLPRWRGAAPVERALMAGDRQTGVCIMRMTSKLDAGAVLASTRCDILAEDTTASLTGRLAHLSHPLLIKLLTLCAETGRLSQGCPQDEAFATYAKKITAEDAQIDWSKSALETERQIRALVDRQGAVTYCPGGEKLVILAARILPVASAEPAVLPGIILPAHRKLQVQCGQGTALEVLQARFSVGKGSMLSGTDLVNGFARFFQAGTRLGRG